VARLCTATDTSALWASQGLQARGLEPLECVSAEMLAQSQCWEHRVDAQGATIDITLARWSPHPERGDSGGAEPAGLCAV
jgi:hypothetical protein